MDDAASRRHPLDVARADGAATAARVPVADFAVIDDGHGFKSAMRMLTNATRGGRVGFEQVRTGVIEQQERADRLGIAVIAEQGADGKAVSHPVAAVCTENFDKFFMTVLSRTVLGEPGRLGFVASSTLLCSAIYLEQVRSLRTPYIGTQTPADWTRKPPRHYE